MNRFTDEAYKLGCGRLYFEHGAIRYLPEEVRRFGTKVYIITGVNAARQSLATVTRLLKENAVPCEAEIYTGPCSEEKGGQIADICLKKGFDVILGLGGGRIMDLTKIAGEIAAISVILMPTISATCADYTPLSVVYTPEGACRSSWYYRREIDCVICDLDELCRQSPRYLAAGMLDAMAKHVEIAHYGTPGADAGQDILLCRMLADNMYDDLFTMGPAALKALREGQTTPELERCIFHALITAGLVSGIAHGKYQTAVGHALYEAIRTLYAVPSRPWLHGEVVALGLLVQEMYLGHADKADKLREFMKNAGMPLTLREIGVNVSDEALHQLARQHPVPNYYHDPEHDPDRLTLLLRKIAG